LGEDTTLKTPDDISMEGRKLHYTPYVITKLESDTNEALIASVENTDDISDTDKALIASIPSPAAAKIASKTDNMNKDKQITTLTNIVNIMEITVNAQGKNQALLQEAFDEEKTLNRKFRDFFEEKMNDAIANLMHVVERHIEEQLEQQLLIINNESAVTNAFLGNQSREIREFQAQTHVQFRNIFDSLAKLRSSLESCRGDTYTSEEQSYVEEDEDESHMSLYDKGSNNEINDHERVPDDEWIPDGDDPICQVASCSKKAFLDKKTGYSPACSRSCYRRLTGNSPKNRSDPQNRSLGADSESRHAHPRQQQQSRQPWSQQWANPRTKRPVHVTMPKFHIILLNHGTTELQIPINLPVNLTARVPMRIVMDIKAAHHRVHTLRWKTMYQLLTDSHLDNRVYARFRAFHRQHHGRKTKV
jgi:hypothetical protein